MHEQVLGALCAFVALHVFYRAWEHGWPDSYFSVGDSVDPLVSRSLLRFALFRMVPVYLVGILLVVTLERLNEPALPAVCAAGALHAVGTNGRSMWRHLGARGSVRSIPVLFNVVAVGLVAAALAAALVTADAVRPLVPGPDKFAEGLWTAVLAAVIAQYLRRVLDSGNGSPDLIERSRRELGEALFRRTRHPARVHDTDARLLQAIMIAENLH